MIAVHQEACVGLHDQKACLGYHSQTPIPAVKLPRGRKKCLLDCNNVGTCFALTGMCQCPAGRKARRCLNFGLLPSAVVSMTTQTCAFTPHKWLFHCRLGRGGVRQAKTAALQSLQARLGLHHIRSEPSQPFRVRGCTGLCLCDVSCVLWPVRRRHRHVLLPVKHDIRAHPRASRQSSG